MCKRLFEVSIAIQSEKIEGACAPSGWMGRMPVHTNISKQ